jgi:hybrid cluster-associated redox disulfide protein
MITRDHLISNILEIKANAAEVLMANGMGCLGCPSSQSETLEQAAEIHGLDIEKLLVELNA